MRTTMSVCIGFVLCLITIAALLWSFQSRKKIRRGDLRRHVEMILDPAGCVDALKRYEECKHIVAYYGIPLSEVGFNQGMEELFVEVGNSLARCAHRQSRTFARVVPI